MKSTDHEDTKAIDLIASILADPEWSVEHIEWVAEAVASVRPNPGGYDTRRDYADVFAVATDRVLPGDNDDKRVMTHLCRHCRVGIVEDDPEDYPDEWVDYDGMLACTGVNADHEPGDPI